MVALTASTLPCTP